MRLSRVEYVNNNLMMNKSYRGNPREAELKGTLNKDCGHGKKVSANSPFGSKLDEGENSKDFELTDDRYSLGLWRDVIRVRSVLQWQ